MRIFFLLIIVISLIVPTYSSEYTNTDGSYTSITLPEGLSETVSKTLQNEIQKRYPTSEIEKVTPVAESVARASLVDEEKLDTSNWEHTIDVRKIYSDEQITSLLMTSYEYTGGAHGSHSRIGIVIDNVTGKTLTLSDLYNTRKLTQRLSPVWQRQISNHLQRVFESKLTVDDKKWIREGTVDIQNYQSFVLTSRALIVYGQEYQHNPYAYGTQTLIYPRMRLKDIAK